MRLSIKILHIISSAAIGGGERYLNDLITHSEDRFNHIVVLPYHGPFETILEKSDFKYCIIDLKKKFSIKSLFEIIKLITKEKIHIVHSHGYRANFYSRVVCIFSRRMNVSTVHVSLFDYIDTSVFKKKCYLFIEKKLSFKTCKFICVSKAMQQDIIRLGISINKTVIIPNGVDCNRFKPNSDDKIKQELGLNNCGPIIGTVGRMVTEKGQIYLIEALKNIKNDWPNIKCLFIGEGPKYQFLQQAALNFGVRNLCIFTGIRYDIEKIYPALDLFVLPSLREPFGLSLLEAMACCIPVISTKKGGPEDFIESGHNGLLVQARNSDALAAGIKFLLTNEHIARSMAINGQDTVLKNYNIKKMVKKITTRIRFNDSALLVHYPL